MEWLVPSSMIDKTFRKDDKFHKTMNISEIELPCKIAPIAFPFTKRDRSVRWFAHLLTLLGNSLAQTADSFVVELIGNQVVWVWMTFFSFGSFSIPSKAVKCLSNACRGTAQWFEMIWERRIYNKNVFPMRSGASEWTHHTPHHRQRAFE